MGCGSLIIVSTTERLRLLGLSKVRLCCVTYYCLQHCFPLSATRFVSTAPPTYTQSGNHYSSSSQASPRQITQACLTSFKCHVELSIPIRGSGFQVCGEITIGFGCCVLIQNCRLLGHILQLRDLRSKDISCLRT